MKEFVKAIMPQLRQFNWKLDAMARITGKSWVVFEESGEHAEMVFRKGGELLIVRNGQVQDARWELIAEMGAIVLDFDGVRKIYESGLEKGPVIVMREHGALRSCLLVDTNWLPANQIVQVMNLVSRRPELLASGLESLDFKSGNVVELIDGRILRTSRTVAYAKTGLHARNAAIVDWDEAADGLYLSKDRSSVFDVRDGALWMVYVSSKLIKDSDGEFAHLYVDTYSGREREEGNVVTVSSRHSFELAPDGVYRIGWGRTVTVQDGRVV